jgi:acetyltransferase-like isoleucine patch superfamily enzyme
MAGAAPRRIPGDWHEGVIPDNAVVPEGAFIETAQVFDNYRSRRDVGFEVGPGTGIYTGTELDVGPRGLVRVGSYTMFTAPIIICDELVEIGSYCLISWSVVIMDSYRTRLDAVSRRAALRRVPTRPARRIEEPDAPARPVRIADNVWLGFDVCVLPGCTIGEGSIVGARSVVAGDIPSYVVAAGNPARVIRPLDPGEAPRTLRAWSNP